MLKFSQRPSPDITATGTVLICHHRTCLKQGAAKVMQTFQTHIVPNYMVVATGCMGECGNGPMVRILPDNIWYSRVQPEEVTVVVEQHLIAGKPIRAMLYRKFHS